MPVNGTESKISPVNSDRIEKVRLSLVRLICTFCCLRNTLEGAGIKPKTSRSRTDSVYHYTTTTVAQHSWMKELCSGPTLSLKRLSVVRQLLLAYVTS